MRQKSLNGKCKHVNKISLSNTEMQVTSSASISIYLDGTKMTLKFTAKNN